ncbi:MAG: FIST N-terminal domain-containing protein [Pirellulales bacterium]
MAQSTAINRPTMAAALSTSAEITQAVAEVCEQVRGQLPGPPDLAMLFLSQHHGPDWGELAARLCDELHTTALLGCTGESIVGGDREIEDQPAMSLWVASLPGVSVQPMHLDLAQTPEGGTIVGWPDDLPRPWPAASTLLLLGEPFSFPADVLLERLNDDQPGIPVVGGMASGGWTPGQNKLFLGRNLYDRGAVAALLHGPLTVRTVVSQGCRPIGRHYVITKAHRNLIQELSGRPPLAVLQELFATLSEAEQALAQRGLHVGRVLNEYQEQFGRGDFLVRNVVGADPESGAIAIGDYVRVGQTVQFHLRDAESADDDLRSLLAESGTGVPAGGLLFTCNGRGTRMFGTADHDAGAIQERHPNMPLAGFFARGEIGPIGGKNFVHGFTASMVLFESQEA